MMTTSATIKGTLFVVATPIGNRSDISLRALEILKAVDVILAEDTRHTLQLLNSFGIKQTLSSLHEYNEKDKSQQIIAKLIAGTSYALLSDAGTPLISDPGYALVSLARTAGVQVIPIPGACAFVTAIQAAGVACDEFSFYGFLPAKSAARRQKLQSCSLIAHTLVFYESKHRIHNCVEDIGIVFGEDVEIVLAKELTKSFETFISGSAQKILAWLNTDIKHGNGEFVLIIPPRVKLDAELDLSVLKELMQELPLKQAVKIAAKIMQQPKNELYKIALDLQGE